MRYLFLLLTFGFTAELEVEGNLKVTGTVDANGNAITNVGEPILSSDVATANYVNTRTAGKGRIITLKCGWHLQESWASTLVGSCEPPQCPENWILLGISNEVTGVSMNGNYSHIVGNTVNYCIEQEDEE